MGKKSVSRVARTQVSSICKWAWQLKNYDYEKNVDMWRVSNTSKKYCDIANDMYWRLAACLSLQVNNHNYHRRS